MSFSATEKEKLLALKGVGETVIARLEQIGFSSLSQLVEEDPAFVPKRETLSKQSLRLHRKMLSEIEVVYEY